MIVTLEDGGEGSKLCCAPDTCKYLMFYNRLKILVLDIPHLLFILAACAAFHPIVFGADFGEEILQSRGKSWNSLV